MSRTIHVAMQRGQGSTPVEAWDCGAGALVVTRSLGADGRPTRHMYTITHEPTGFRALPLHTPRRDAAEEVARELAGLLDWSRVTGDPDSTAPESGGLWAVFERLRRQGPADWYETAFDPPADVEVEPLAGGSYRLRWRGGPWRRVWLFEDVCDAAALLAAGEATVEQIGEPMLDDADGLAGPVEADRRMTPGGGL